MTHTNVGKHALSATAEPANLLVRTTTRKVFANIHVNRECATRIRARSNVTTVSYTRPIPVVVSHPRPPLLPPLPLLECALEPPITGVKSERASVAHSVPEIDSSTGVRHTWPVRRWHCRGELLWFQKIPVHLSQYCPITAQIASVKSPRAPTPCVDYSHSVVSAAGTRALSVVPLNQVIVSTAKTRALSAAPFGHGLSSATGNRASSAVPLGRRHKLGNEGARSNRRPPQPWHVSMRFARSP